MYRLLQGPLMRDLQKIIFSRTPLEAVGLILPDDRVVELTNVAPDASANFIVHGEEVARKLTDSGWALDNLTLSRTTLWHSHPGGGIGPSRVDMQARVKPMSHLVLSLDGEALIASWY